MANGWLLSILLAAAVCSGSAEGYTKGSLVAGDRVVSKISYASKKGKGHVVTGERGKVVRVEKSGKTAYAFCDFPSWQMMKVKVTDLGRVGDATIGEWRVGDEVISGGSLDDGEWGSVKQGDPGVVLGVWEKGQIHCKFANMRRKNPVWPNMIHRRIAGKQGSSALLDTGLAIFFVVVVAYNMTSSCGRGEGSRKDTEEPVRDTRPVLVGGFRPGDKVLSLHTEPRLGLAMGDTGMVLRCSTVDPSTRLFCSFGSQNINIAINQIIRKGEQTLGPFRAGDKVLANLDGDHVTLLNGGILRHGTKGTVLKRADGQEDRITCVFQGLQTLVSVLVTEVKHKRAVREDERRSQAASETIRREQREQQQEVLKARQDSEDTADEEVADPFLCRMCEALLLEPVTLGCGHTLCKHCVEDWKKFCPGAFRSPCCARVMPCEWTERADMQTDIELCYPKELALRRAEVTSQPADAELTTVQEIVQQLGPALHQVGATVQQMMQAQPEALGNAVPNPGEELVKELAPVFNQVGVAVQRMMQVQPEELGNAAPNQGELVQHLAPIFNQVGLAMQQMMQGQPEALGNLAPNQGEAPAQQLGPVFNQFGMAIQQMMQAQLGTPGIPNQGEALAPLFNQFGMAMQQMMQAQLDTPGDLMPDQGEAFLNQLGVAMQQMMQIQLQALGNLSSNQVKEIVEHVGPVFNQLVVAMRRMMEGLPETSGNLALNQGEAKESDIKEHSDAEAKESDIKEHSDAEAKESDIKEHSDAEAKESDIKEHSDAEADEPEGEIQ